MSTENKRKALLGRLSRNLMVTVPMMTVVAVAGAGFNAGVSSGFGLIPSAEAAQGEAEGEARGEAEGEARGEAEGAGEARAEGEAEGYAEGEGEAEGEVPLQPSKKRFAGLTVTSPIRVT
jgi:flagellar biosynthesis/type III secretory pathway protein FliH